MFCIAHPPPSPHGAADSAGFPEVARVQKTGKTPLAVECFRGFHTAYRNPYQECKYVGRP
ncbi:hypothetical protein GCM10023156_68210 [Novipirellula rosea]|uniref:Uncharacterized protein n=1 Tax=Novipirellula rosea TaxID=1031540 RepID=A0ABP8NW05_9BACT